MLHMVELQATNQKGNCEPKPIDHNDTNNDNPCLFVLLVNK